MKASRQSIGGLLALAAAVCAPLICEAAPEAHILIVLSSSVPAYQEALSGFSSVIPKSATKMTVLEMGEDQAALGQAVKEHPGVIVTMGSHAAEWARSTDPTIPVISTMMLESEGNKPAAGPSVPRRIGGVTLDLPAEIVLTKLKNTFPGTRQVAVIYNPTNTGFPKKAILAHAQRLGYTIKFVECQSPKEVLDAFGSLRGAADFVWCFPERALYQPAMVNAMIMASIRNRLPIIGFSESFVRAGALIGFFPDYYDIGAQTAELVRKHEAGQSLTGTEPPRKCKAAINQRVVRVLGLEPEPAGKSEVTRIQ